MGGNGIGGITGIYPSPVNVNPAGETPLGMLTAMYERVAQQLANAEKETAELDRVNRLASRRLGELRQIAEALGEVRNRLEREQEDAPKEARW